MGGAKPPPAAVPATESDPLLQPAANTAAVTTWLESREEQRRKRIMLALTLLAAFLAVVGALLVWRLNVWQRLFRAELPSLQAAKALDRLNHHIHEQSKHVTAGCESTLLLFRHCEKVGPYVEDAIDFDTTNEHCSYLGYERASYLTTLFGNHRRDRWPIPAHLFALSPDRGDHLNFQEWETLQPLSKQSGIVTEIVDQYSLPKMYFELLQSGVLCGQVAVVTWKDEYIPELAHNLACGPDNGCPDSYPEDSFDMVWQLKYVFHPDTQFLLDRDKEHEIKNASNITSTTKDNNKDDKGLASNNVEYNATGDANNDPANNFLRRRSQRRRLIHHTKPFSRHGWNVYATVSYQNFDPLAYSKLAGDYPKSGTAAGGRWKQGPPPLVRRLINEHDDEI